MTPTDAAFRFCDSIAITDPLENIGLQIVRELRLVSIIAPYEQYCFSHDPIERVPNESSSSDLFDVFETTLTFSFSDGREVFLALTCEPTPILEPSLVCWILTTVTVCDIHARIPLLTWRPIQRLTESYWEKHTCRPIH